MLKFLEIFWVIFQIIIAAYLLFPFISYILFSFKENKPFLNSTPSKSFDHAFIVTAYENSSNLDNLIASILKQNHPSFTIYIVADNCPDYQLKIRDSRVVLIKPNEIFSNQVKSHFFAINNFTRQHDFLTIIDSDNLVKQDFLDEIEKFINYGFDAIQGLRRAKNLNTDLACIDAMNEIYYVYFDRKILFGIGSSSMLSGSGMTFKVELYKAAMQNVTNSGAGFDKILQKEIIEQGHRIAFAEKAIVYDEKSSFKEQIIKQRARWNNTWFRYFPFAIKIISQGVVQRNWNKFLFGFVLSRPPLFLLLLVVFLIFFISLWLNMQAAIIWFVFFVIFILGFFISLFNSNADKRIYKSIVYIPNFIWLQFLSLIKVRKANAYSVATEHSVNKNLESLE